MALGRQSPHARRRRFFDLLAKYYFSDAGFGEAPCRLPEPEAIDAQRSLGLAGLPRRGVTMPPHGRYRCFCGRRRRRLTGVRRRATECEEPSATLPTFTRRMVSDWFRDSMAILIRCFSLLDWRFAAASFDDACLYFVVDIFESLAGRILAIRPLRAIGAPSRRRSRRWRAVSSVARPRDGRRRLIEIVDD